MQIIWKLQVNPVLGNLENCMSANACDMRKKATICKWIILVIKMCVEQPKPMEMEIIKMRCFWWWGNQCWIVWLKLQDHQMICLKTKEQVNRVIPAVNCPHLNEPPDHRVPRFRFWVQVSHLRTPKLDTAKNIIIRSRLVLNSWTQKPV